MVTMLFVTPIVVTIFLSILKTHYFGIAFYNHIICHSVVLFNFYFTLYGASELRIGGTIANADDMIYDI